MCYVYAEEMRRKQKDTEAWQAGMYTMSAVLTAVSKCLSGRKSKAKYIERPMTETLKEKQKEDENLTEQEKDAERQKLLTALMTMQANFELNHSGGD